MILGPEARALAPMNRLTKFLFLAAAAVVVLVATMVSRQKLRTPREILDEVRLELQTEGFDRSRLLRQLEAAIRRAEQQDLSQPGVVDLCTDLRTVRGQLLVDLGAYSEAQRDLEVVLERYRPGDSEVRRLVIEIQGKEGDLQGALENLERLIQNNPDYGPAWVDQAQLHQRLAEQDLDLAREKLRYVLVVEDYEVAAKRVLSLAARAPEDPLRISDILTLRELVPSSDQETLAQVLELADSAAAELQLARSSYLTGFQHGLYPESVHGYLELLVAAERTTEAIHLGSLVLARGELSNDQQIAELLIHTLTDVGDWRHASELATKWLRKSPTLPTEFLKLACLANFQAQHWGSLFTAATRLRSIGSVTEVAQSSFYRGFAFAKANKPNLAQAREILKAYTRGRSPEPFPGARREAWTLLAELEREAGNTIGEREAIQGALEEGAEQSGPMWLRLSELQSTTRHSGYQLPLESLTRAMALMPKRTEELLPLFEDLGQKALEAQDRDVGLILDDLNRRGQTVPRREYGPYVLLELARLQGQAGKAIAQLALAKRLLSDFPGFLPAHDQLIAATIATGNRRYYIELVVQRADLAGLDAVTLGLLGGISESELRSGQLVRLMQADTEGTGRLVVAKWLYQHGEFGEALKTLEAPAQAARSEQELLLGARMELEAGEYRRALNWLAALPPDASRGRERRQLTLLCALQLGDTELLGEITRELLQTDALRLDDSLRIADTMLRFGAEQGAMAILNPLQSRLGQDLGPVLLRRALTLLAAGDLAGSAAAAERAEPFLTELQGSAMSLLLASSRGDWLACQSISERLLELAPPEAPELAALLFLLVGREQEALELAEFAIELVPEAPIWTLIAAIGQLRTSAPLVLPEEYGSRAADETRAILLGSSSAPRDPRELVSLLLASELPAFRAYLQGELRSLDRGTCGELWPTLLEASLLDKMGYTAEGIPLLEGLAASYPDCLPVWDRIESLAARQLGSPDHPRVAELREARLFVVAQANPDGPEARLLEAMGRRRAGEFGTALRAALVLSTERPGWYDAEVLLARLHTDQGNWQAARKAWRGLLSDAETGHRVLPEYLEMLRSAHARAPEVIPTEVIKAELAALAAAYPGDPRVPLALARLDLEMDPRNPAIGVARALTRLEHFREKFPGVSLEELQRDSTAAWAKLYVEIAPSAAETFLSEELELQPGDTELWRLLGRVQRELGNLDASVRWLMLASRIAPSPQLELELARTLIATGADTSIVNSAIKSLRSDPTPAAKLESALLLAESQLNQTQEQAWEKAVDLLEPFWEARGHLDRSEDRARLSLLFARGLLLRGQQGDAERALSVLQEGRRFSQTTYQREAMEALSSTARALASELT